MFFAPPQPLGPLDVSQRLELILGTLRRAAAAHASRYWAHAPIVLLLWPYLNRVARRLDALAARIRSGRLRIRAPRPIPTEPQAPENPAARKARLPSMRGWLIWMLPCEAACVASQLRHLLADPEMAAVFAAAPDQAARIFRPLCRMLLIEPGPDLPPALFATPKAPEPPAPFRPAAYSAHPSKHAEAIDGGGGLPPPLSATA